MFPPPITREMARQMGLGNCDDFAHEFEGKDELWARAAQDPSSISAEERRIILRRPSEATEAANIAYVTSSATSPGLTLEQFITKAAEQPDSLSAKECDLITSDLNLIPWQRSTDRSLAKLKIGRERSAALFAAQNAVRSDDERAALENAHRVWAVRSREETAEHSRQKAILQERLLSPPDWIQKLDGEWGFAIYRCQECAIGDKWFWRWKDFIENRKNWGMRSGFAFVGGKEAMAKQQLQLVDMIASEEQISEFRQ